MDKLKLTEDQLSVLTSFIHARGFKDPLVSLEILDHFACKVEELLANEPALSLEEAMDRAHQSFGVTGFLAIAVAYERQLTRKYKSVYREHLKRIFSSVPYLVMLILTGLVIHQAFLWAAHNNYAHVFGTNDVSALLTTGFLVCEAGLHLGRRGSRGLNMMVSAAEQQGWVFFPLWLLIMPIHGYSTEQGLLVGAVVHGIYAAVCLATGIARFRTVSQAARDARELTRYLIAAS